MARLLADHFGALDPLLEATDEELQEIKGIGPEVAKSVHRFLPERAQSQVLERLKGAGVKPVHEKRARGPQPLAGEIMVFTGTLEDDAASRGAAARRGSRRHASRASVGKKVTLVVAGPGAGSKLDDAGRLGIPVIDEGAFLKRLNGR